MSGSKKADRLRKARLSAGFRSASEAARSLGVSTATYIHHENGTRDFGEGPAAIYARRYHVTQSWLLLGDGEMRDSTLEEQQISEISERTEDRKLHHEFLASLTPEERQRRRDDEKRRTDEEILKITKEMAFVPEIFPEFSRAEGLRTWRRFADFEDPVYHPIASTWGIPLAHLQYEMGSPPNSTILFPIIGNANAKSLVHGDLAIVAAGSDEVIADGFYLVADKVSHPQVRYLRINLFSDPTTVTMFAEASPDDKQTLEVENISIVGKVVGRISRM